MLFTLFTLKEDSQNLASFITNGGFQSKQVIKISELLLFSSQEFCVKPIFRFFSLTLINISA